MCPSPQLPVSRAKRRQSGSALILLSIMLMFVVIPMVGLAIDGGMAYLVQSRLSAACDAAALAGARSLSVGILLEDQEAQAKATVTKYLQSDFPDGLYNTSDLTITTNDISETAYKTRTVSVAATINYPTLFMGIVGEPTATIAASAQTTRRDVNIILVLDRSGSMASAGVCGKMKASAQDFADKFVNGRDRLGLVTFTAVPSLDYAPTVNFKSQSPSLDDTLANISCGGNTGSAHALWLGYQQLQAINQPGSLNLIVFFTDGLPNGVTARLPVKTQQDVRYGAGRTGTLTTTPPSGCLATELVGAVAQGAGQGNATTGYTTGVFDTTPIPVSDTNNPLLSSPGCAYPSNSVNMRLDVAYMPDSDINGNSTTGYKTVPVFPSGPYVNLKRVDTPQGITTASQNAADNAASRIRGDNSLLPVIYSIGLGGTGAEPLDQVFLRRVANDPQSPIFDPSEPQGLYVYAPDASQLDNAFNTVASQILRLSR